MRKAILLIGLAVALPASAAQEWHTANVTRTLVQEGAFGNCMAQISPDLSATGLDCKAAWVSFSCSGDFNSEEMGDEKMAAAQLALVTGNRVTLRVNDAKKHNGYCFAERVDNRAN